LVFQGLAGLFGPYLAAAVIFLALPALGVLGKWAFDEISAANAKRRDFVAKTSDKVVGLAWDHYWGLANASGTLAGRLTSHLRVVDAHLLIHWQDRASLDKRMNEIADATAKESFASFVRLLHAFERFQFRGSNTYLLPHHSAGEALRRLYNRFVESLGDELKGSLTPIRLAVERMTAERDKEGHEKPPDLGSAKFEMPPWSPVEAKREGEADAAAEARREGKANNEAADLARAQKRYATWLKSQPAAVAEAADALHAFSRLLTHELAELHTVWHRDRGPFSLPDAFRQAKAAVEGGAWPGVLDDRAVEAIARARSASPFFSPLSGMPESREQAPEPKSEEQKDQHEKAAQPTDTTGVTAPAGRSAS
jgi:hypothetical protein